MSDTAIHRLVNITLPLPVTQSFKNINKCTTNHVNHLGWKTKETNKDKFSLSRHMKTNDEDSMGQVNNSPHGSAH